ncbi:SLC13 family permease [Spirochaetota bacterium]
MKYFVLSLAAIMYGLVIALPQRKTWFALGSAFIVGFLGLVSPKTIFVELINWNVLLIYIGSLIIADLFIYSRAPSRMADIIVIKSPRLGLAVVFILIMTGLLSAFVENVATVLVMAPIALALSSKMKIDPRQFMIGLAVMSNLQGTATLIGDPPSMIFAAFAGYSFNDFFFKDGKASIFFTIQAGMLVGVMFFYLFYKGTKETKMDLPKEKVKAWFPSVLLIMLILGLAVISFLFKGFSILSGSFVFLLGIIGLLWYRYKMKEPWSELIRLVKSLDWETLLFLIGIFVLVGTISETGLLKDFAGFLSRIIGNNVVMGFVIIIGFSVLLSGFVDNVPYIIVMLPVIAELIRDMGLKQELYMFGLLIGSCIGGNLTPFGASANVVAAGMLKKNGTPASFMDWIKIAAPFTVLTTAAASAFVWFVWR